MTGLRSQAMTGAVAVAKVIGADAHVGATADCLIVVLARMSGLRFGGMIGTVRPSVLIVDDHRRFRASARALLESEGFEVVGEAANGADALRQAEALRPGLVLLDIQLPDFDGFNVAGELNASSSPPKVILISSRAADSYGDRIGVAPVLGFMPKSELSGASIDRLLA